MILKTDPYIGRECSTVESRTKGPEFYPNLRRVGSYLSSLSADIRLHHMGSHTFNPLMQEDAETAHSRPETYTFHLR
jgi:hypothetical protein